MKKFYALIPLSILFSATPSQNDPIVLEYQRFQNQAGAGMNSIIHRTDQLLRLIDKYQDSQDIYEKYLAYLYRDTYTIASQMSDNMKKLTEKIDAQIEKYDYDVESAHVWTYNHLEMLKSEEKD